MSCNCPYCGRSMDALKKFRIDWEGDKVDYRVFRRRVLQGQSKQSAIRATRKHGKHYSVLNANNRKKHKQWDSYKNFIISDFSEESDADQSSPA